MKVRMILCLLLLFGGQPLFAAGLDRKYETVRIEVYEFLAKGNYQEAEKVLEDFLKKEEGNLNPSTLELAYSELALTKYWQDKDEEIVEMLQQAVDRGIPNLSGMLEGYKKRLKKPKPAGGRLKNKSSCMALGGRWEGGKSRQYCNQPTRDAGKKCQDSAECEGSCLVDEKILRGTKTPGKCSAWTVSHSCASLVNKGIAQGSDCVERPGSQFLGPK